MIVGVAGKAFTVTDTCPLTVENPSFTATLYVVLTVGVAAGFASVDVNPAGTDVQLYVYVPDPPLAPASSATLAPTQIVPGVAFGVALNAPPDTVTVTASEFEHPVVVEVAVSVKTVVEDKLTVVGSSAAGFTRSADGAQLYVNGPVPVTVLFSCVLVPFGILTSVPAFTTGSAFTVTVVAADGKLWHPLISVILTV